jgi:uncharacterized protein
MNWFDPVVAVAGLLVGTVVGLTGMGGGALLTPILVYFFGVPPLAAVSSDVVASFFMKPIGGFVHLRRGTVHLRLVGWLCLGSVPAAFTGVVLLRALGDGEDLQRIVVTALGTLLVLASGAMAAKAYLTLRARSRRRREGTSLVPLHSVQARPLPTVAIGALAGLIVGMTSVGAGSVLIVCLMLLYPRITTRQLVGTDLVQAVPLVASASLGHIFFGDFQFGLAGSILVGAIPGVWMGARISSRTAGSLVRRALAVVMLASGVKLLGAPTAVVGLVALGAAVLGAAVWAAVRVRHGEAPLIWQQRRRKRARGAATPDLARDPGREEARH